MKTLIKDAIIVDLKNKYHNKKWDILLELGKIISIDKSISANNVEQISFPNLHISLGWFDSSISFGEPGFEQRETLKNGLEVAAKSGFTDIILNPNTNPIPDTGTHIHAIISKTKTSAVNVFPMGALTENSQGENLAELFDMKSNGAIAFGDFKKPIKNSNLLKIALLYSQNFKNGGVISFPQDAYIGNKGFVNEGDTSITTGLKSVPNLSEELQIMRDLAILEYTGGKLHIPTISTTQSVNCIKKAKEKGLDITCSVAIHNLIFSDEYIKNFDANYKVLPPLRTSKDIIALKKGINSGIIDFVTTDHMPVDIENKKMEFNEAMFGTIGLETAFGSLNQLLGIEKTIELLTKGRSNFFIKEPTIEEGVEVSLTLFNPEPTYVFSNENILSTSKNSAFLGSKLKGIVYGTINGRNKVFN